ncbi:hypothetical protein G9P44_001661 [Scheffersomyces stipitis]|nr:hypothetical protein G9P44_001661 [Scheffersomyces stipitis]
METGNHKSVNGSDAISEIGAISDSSQTQYIKQSLLHSPIITNIFPQFKVNIAKPFRGLSSASFNDEEYQVLIPKEEDSQLDVFSEDEVDEDLFLSQKEDSQQPEKDHNHLEQVLPSQQAAPDAHNNTKLRQIKVLVKLRSLLVNGIDFPTKTEIRDSCVVSGVCHYSGRNSSQNDYQNDEEDSLLISLKSGYLLLIRMYYVPRYYKDSDYSLQTNESIANDGTSIFKPFIVQWWDTSSELTLPTLECSGYSLSAHRSGLSVVSASASKSFRIYQTQHTNPGISFKKHYNVGVDGLILHSCFAEPFHTFHDNKAHQHNIFLTLAFTEFKRLVINLFSWSNTEGVGQSFSKSTLPLDNSFEIPIFVISLAKNASFLFVNRDSLVIVTIHDIMSACYGFKKIPAPWKAETAFPTSKYVPEFRISELGPKSDEVLVATDSGTIYSLVITNNELVSSIPIIKVSDPVAVFSLEKCREDYNLIYASDCGSNKDLLLSKLNSKEEVGYDIARLPYTEAKLIKDYKNWCPLIDIEIVDSKRPNVFRNKVEQELWGISGIGKKMKLSQFRHGYTAIRKSNTYEKLRKAKNMFYFEINQTYFVLCSFTFESTLLEFQTNGSEAFAEIEDSNLITNEETLYARVIPLEEGQLLFQVTPTHILISDLTDSYSKQSMEKFILLCDSVDTTVVFLTEEISTGNIAIELYDIDPLLFAAHDVYEGSILVLRFSTALYAQPSFVRLVTINSIKCLVVGTFESEIIIYDISQLENKETVPITISLSNLNPYSATDITQEDLLIPDDTILIKNQLFVSTRDGFYINLSLSQSEVICNSFLKLSDTNIRFCPAYDDPNLVFIFSKSLWLLNSYESQYPKRVHFDDKYDRTIAAMAELPSLRQKDESNRYFAVIKDDGLSICSVSTFAEANVKQFVIPESAKKLYYLEHLSIFIIMSNSSNPRGRLKFFDTKNCRLLKHREGTIKSTDEEVIFSDNEYPTSACVWSIKRNGRISKKILIGSTIEKDCNDPPLSKMKIVKGSFKVVDISRGRSSDDQTGIKVLELTSFEHSGPITNIISVRSEIIFSSGSSICSTSYDETEKRLKPVMTLFSVPSEVTSIVLESDNQLLVSTKMDSIYRFLYRPNEPRKDSLVFVASDQHSNSYLNQAQLGSNIITGDKLHSSIAIIDIDQNRCSTRLNYKMNCIPRVYSAGFHTCWVKDEKYTKKMALCIGVNGEISSVREVTESDEELTNLKMKLSTAKLRKAPLIDLVEKLEMPFANKISGTGLLSLNKPSFDYKGNRGTLIDYDLEEISICCESNVTL